MFSDVNICARSSSSRSESRFRLTLYSSPIAFIGRNFPLSTSRARGGRAESLSRRLGRSSAISLVYKTVAGRGRSVLAQQALAAGSSLVECTPIAKVVKTAPVDVNWCQHCLGVAPRGMRYCSAACADDSAGLRFLERVDLSSLEALHREQQRKFPLLVAQLLSQLLTGIQRTGAAPAAWEHAMALCHANLEPEAMPQVEAEHAQLRDAFAAAGIASAGTLELLLPLARYAQLLGAALHRLLEHRGLQLAASDVSPQLGLSLCKLSVERVL